MSSSMSFGREEMPKPATREHGYGKDPSNSSRNWTPITAVIKARLQDSQHKIGVVLTKPLSCCLRSDCVARFDLFLSFEDTARRGSGFGDNCVL